MTECAFCFSMRTDGEPTSHYRIRVPGHAPEYRWLCVGCAESLRRLGVEVSEDE